MMIIVFLLILFAGAYGMKKVIGYSIEESLFINILFIIVLLLVCGLVGMLSAGFYLAVAAFCAIFVLGVIKTVKEKSFDLYEILTPGISVFLISSFLYFISVKSLGFYWWDEASHWGTAVKHMYLSNQMYYGLQTMGVPMFSYFIVKIAGYSEGLIFLSRWIFMWSAVAILMKGVTWKSWYIAAVGGVLTACISNIFATEPIFYMDTPLGIVSGAIIAYKMLNKNFGNKDFVLVLSGVFVITQVKYGTGIEFAFFISVFFLIDELIRSRRKITSISKFAAMLGMSVFAYFISVWSKADIPGYFESKATLPLEKLFGLLLTKSTFALVFAIVFLIVFALFIKYNSKISIRKNYNLLKYSSISLMLVAVLTLLRKIFVAFSLSLDIFARSSFVGAMRRMFYEDFLSKPVYVLLLFVLIFTIIICLLIKKENKKRYLVGNITVVIFVIIYGIFLALSYTFLFESWESTTLMSYRRYYGSVIVFMSIFVLSVVLYQTDLFTNDKHRLFASLALALILVRSYPLPSNLLFKQTETSYISYEYGIKEYGKETANDINRLIPTDSNVFIVCQNNGAIWSESGVANWVHYYIAPRNTNFVDFSFGSPYSEEDIYTEDISAKDLLARISKYDYVYIDNADDVFYSRYGKMFDVLPDNSRAVYEYANGSLYLIWQGESIR